MSDKVERQKEHFDSIADTYYAARQSGNHILLKDLMWSDFLADKSVLRKDGLRVLEAMCGFAEGKRILEENLKVSVAYTGFDYSSAVVDRLRRLQPQLDITRQDATTFKTADIYDVVILLGGLHHVHDAAATVVMRLAGCLDRGGYFINLEPTSGNRLFTTIRNRIYRKNRIFDEQTEKGFDVEELLSMFRMAGLRPVDVAHPRLLFYILYYNPDAFSLLNIGGARTVKALYSVDRLFFRTWLGRALSFATLSLWRKV